MPPKKSDHPEKILFDPWEIADPQEIISPTLANGKSFTKTVGDASETVPSWQLPSQQWISKMSENRTTPISLPKTFSLEEILGLGG